MVSINPATGKLLREFPSHSDADLELALDRAARAFAEYRNTRFEERSRSMWRVAEILEASRRTLGRIMAQEMGKPLRAAVQEAEKCAMACRYYAENAARFLADEPVPNMATTNLVRYQPLGTVLAVMPWNFPFWQVFRFAAPALMAGNVGLLKHASNVPQCALEIEGLFRAAGFPEGVFQTLLVGSERVEKLVQDPRVAAVTLTGSLLAGRSVASAAGKAIKKTVLELGGSDPFIVMPSADLEKAIRTAVQARTVNNGQSCIAAKRFVIHQRIADEFQRGFVAAMAALRVGDPLDDLTDIGPLATAAVLEGLEAQVDQSISMGARVLLGGKRLAGPGNFFAPTVLTDIPRESPAYNEELFGPVASLFRVADLDEAIEVANDTPFGLGSCIWTRDETERGRFLDRIQAGLAFVNCMVASDPRLPFGGIKQSGYGRELGEQGIREFVNTKAVCIQ